MTSPPNAAPFAIPTAASPQALAFLQGMQVGAPVQLTAESMPARRQAAALAYQPRIDRALQHFPSRCATIQVGGIDCLALQSNQGEAKGTLLYCYGGGFITGYPEQDMPILAALAAHTGMRLVVPHYRLAPEHPWPAALDDVLAVYRALAASEPASSLALVGESSGGNLALSLMLRLAARGIDQPRVAALMSPWCDIRLENDYGHQPEGFDPCLSSHYLHQAARMYTGTAASAQAELSPLYGKFNASFPPTLITTASRDLLQRDCALLAGNMRAGGVAVALDVWPSLWHVFEYYDEIPEAGLSLQRIAGFLKR